MEERKGKDKDHDRGKRFVFYLGQSSTHLETKGKEAGDKENKDNLGMHSGGRNTGTLISSRYRRG